MIDLGAFRGKQVLVYGCGASGLACARSLEVGGAHVQLWDDYKEHYRKLSSLAEGLTHADVVVLSPGVAVSSDLRVQCEARNIPVVGDVELFWRAVKGRCCVVGVTGTNGKSTTTALLAHVLRESGKRVRMGGNIGVPVLCLPEPRDPCDVYVVEVSSYQIDLTSTFSPDVAILLNLSPDHIDRHGSFDHYVAVKRRLLDRQTSPEQMGFIGLSDPATRSIFAQLKEDQHPCLIGVSDQLNLNQAIVRHVCQKRFNLEEADILLACSTFRGLPHRLQVIGESADGILFVNDSKATNAHATRRALETYIRDGCIVFWIAGGLPKDGGITSLSPLFPQIRSAYFFGHSSQEFSKTFSSSSAGSSHMCGSLRDALQQAVRDARDLPQGNNRRVILLSPACASFDQFKNFEERGNTFIQAVRPILAAKNSEALPPPPSEQHP